MSSSNLEMITGLITRFDPVSLDETDRVRLMDRRDLKFILPLHLLGQILAELQGDYRILTIDDNRIFSYRTRYFDTPELVMFFDHHNGKLNRFKVRHREYLETQLCFLEVKFKSNTGRVIKQRIEDSRTDKHIFSGFVTKHTPYNPAKLHCAVTSQFNRFTLVEKRMQERVTTDFNLSFSDGIRCATLDGLVVIELKQEQTDKNSIIYNVLRKYGIRPSSISKYCIGISLLNEKTKANNFKKIIKQINKISHVERIT